MQLNVRKTLGSLLGAALICASSHGHAETYRMSIALDRHEQPVVVHSARGHQLDSATLTEEAGLTLVPGTFYLVAFQDAELDEETPFNDVTLRLEEEEKDVELYFDYRVEYNSGTGQPIRNIRSEAAYANWLSYLEANGIRIEFRGAATCHGLPGPPLQAEAPSAMDESAEHDTVEERKVQASPGA